MKAVELSRAANGLSSMTRSLRCVVITPVGPGHETLVHEAITSVVGAFRAAPGPFTGLTILPLDDLEGKMGRSRRRNDGIDYALSNGFDWIFFLDADDFMAPNAFVSAAPYFEDYDAVFGLIAETKNREAGEASFQVNLRANQIRTMTGISDVLRNDPFLTLQMGHFVRTRTAAGICFDVKMNAGEDFKYYLGLWNEARCIKIDQVLFINRRGSHSSGPRSANWRQWQESVAKVIREFPGDKA